MTEKEKRDEGLLYDYFKVPEALAASEKARAAVKKFNSEAAWGDTAACNELKKIFGGAGENLIIVPPFYCDIGDTIFIGDNFYANTGLLVLDEGKVIFGNNVWIGPRVSIYTAGHPLVPEVRNTGLEFAKPVTIGDNVWIGGNVVIVPGVTIGKGSTIGSGSVVTKDIPENVVAAGNPCRVIREINDKDREFWEKARIEHDK